jgi:hypothetical protein
MSFTRARGRYLALLGLSTTFGAGACRSGEPAKPSATPSETASAPEAATAQPAVAHSAPWVPAPDPSAQSMRRRPGMCPHGPFCVPQASAVPPPTAADAGAVAAPSPYEACAASVAIPAGMGPIGTADRQPNVGFDAIRTAAERATDAAACCYQWTIRCVGGRPLRGSGDGDAPVTAPSARREDWLAATAVDAPVDLDPATRAALAAHWEREASFEHASVAAFARVSLALLSLGAPPDLLASTHAAAMEEVQHARATFALASAYAGAPRGPGPLPLASGGISLAGMSLAKLAEEALVDGCVGEAAAALVLREAEARADDEALRATLGRIASDEERHAELAWRTVAWALASGGEDVRRALEGAIAALRCELGEPYPAPSGPDLARYGAIGAAEQRRIRARTIEEVVLPCVAALLATGQAPGALATS